MALYNVHKRKTLDRLTLTYQLQLREVYRKKTEGLVSKMHAALDGELPQFDPFDAHDKQLDERLHKVFKQFQDHVIVVGISDGIQEVSPENKLGAWEKYPIDMPIESTIPLEGGVALAGRRDDLAEQYKKKRAVTLADRLREYIEDSKNNYLHNIRKAFANAANGWLAGEHGEDEVKLYLRKALVSTDSESQGILRTETTNYFNTTRHDYFASQTAADWIELYAVTDGRISKICEDRHGFCIPMGKAGERKYMPAFHKWCRTIQRPLFSSLPSHRAIIQKSESMNEASFTPLPRGWA